MDCLHDFDIHLRWVFAACRERIASYPAVMRQEGIDLFEKYHVFNPHSHKNYISYLLPFWIQPTFALDMTKTRKISLGNTFLMLYILVQDAVMDTPPGEYKANLLPLGNLLLQDCMEQYRSLFSSDSLFWDYLRHYFCQWSDSVLRERREQWDITTGFYSSDMTLEAQKAAPLKAPCAAACLLCERRDILAPLEKSVDTLLVSLQLLDDWSDWRQDLADGHCTYFLFTVMKYCRIDNFQSLNHSHVHTAVYAGDVLNTVFELVEKNHVALKEESGFLFPNLEFFSQALAADCRRILDEIEAERKLQLKGGFASWLYRRM